ncbi:hypothetical protein BYT27DRAFT_6959207 [Phlegmacium glaucopus]|nr:hypothetical protein BYT27DRAFT_6959207 [Phlegmacium glaucopus]
MSSVCKPQEYRPCVDPPNESTFSVSEGTLYPILAQHTARYDVVKSVRRKSAIIKSGMFQSSRNPSPTYMPPQWSAYIHPEGKAYFCRHFGLHIVTEAYMYDPSIAEKVCAWATEVERQAEIQGLELDGNVELFLEIDDDDCSYYLIDRATETLFWLTEYTTGELGLKSVVSDSHLKLLLEAQYWSHIENFCMHFGGLPPKAIDDLILVFLHALADNLTSNLSTFPYTTAQCEKFLELLKFSRDRIHEGHVVAYVGRIWSIILYNRYETHYGEEQSRLSRDCAILVDKSKEVQWTRPLLSLLSLQTSDRYLTALDALYVDQYVYGHAWTTFMGTCLKTWRQDCCTSVILLLLHIVCLFQHVSSYLAYASSIMASTSLLTGILLLHRHEGMDNAEAHQAQTYLNGVRSDRFKFQGVALAYSLPRVFSLVGFVALFCQWAVLIWENNHPIQAIPFIFLILAFFVGLQQLTSQTSILRTLTSNTARLCRIFRRFRSVQQKQSAV